MCTGQNHRRKNKERRDPHIIKPGNGGFFHQDAGFLGPKYGAIAFGDGKPPDAGPCTAVGITCSADGSMLEQCDAIVTPTTPTAAFKVGEKTDDPLQMYLSDIFTISTNLAGIPGISLPCGYTRSGLPIGLQIQAGHFQEGKLIQAAAAYEKNAKFEKRRPNL